MITSGICACGRPADSFGGLCDRCVALQTLGLISTASDEQIENAYRTLVKVWHPDRFQTDPRLKMAAEEKLKEINSAHDSLVSGPPVQAPLPAIRKPGPAETPDEPAQAPQRKTTPFIPNPDAEVPKEVQRILRRHQHSPVPGSLVTAGFVLGALAVLALVGFSVDAFLSSNQSTALAWARKKSELSLELRSAGARLWSGATENLKDSKPSDTSPPATPTQSNPTPVPSQPPEPLEHKAAQDHAKASGQTVRAQPYITAGLTPEEVLSVLGNPTSSSGEKMFYKGSEIDFQNGHLVRWKIDPVTASIRVKLWPDVPPVPGLTVFGVGSSKSDVISLQGTPTLFSRNEFGYGNSVIFFLNDRVVGWKEDPASVRLKVAR